MVRDLALYLDAYAAESVAIDSVAALQSFNNQSIDLRAPYGQALVDMMAELQLDAQAHNLSSEAADIGRLPRNGLSDAISLDRNAILQGEPFERSVVRVQHFDSCMASVSHIHVKQ